MPWKNHKIDNYEIILFDTKPGGEPALIACYDQNILIRFWFVEASDDRKNKIAKGSIDVYFPVSAYPRVLDLLRNESPAYFRIQDPTLQAQLSTGSEPVGEGE